MRVVSAVVSALVVVGAFTSSGCAARRAPAPGVADHLRTPSQWCFHADGIDVFAPSGEDCPRPVAFSSDTGAVLRHAGLAEHGFIGVRVVYVRGAIECNGVQSFGCTDVNRRVSVVSLDTPWPRRLTQHELGHQAVKVRGMPERRQDHRDPWWRSAAVSVRRH